MTFPRYALLLLLASCATQSALDQSRHYASIGDTMRAYRVLDELRTEQLNTRGEVDAELAEAHELAYRDYLLARAQERIFQESEELALGDLAELESIAPGHPGIEELRARALRKRAKRLTEAGHDHLRRKDYVRALVSFRESQAIAPELEGSEKGIEEVRAATARMGARAQEQFLEAVRKLPELRFPEVQWHAANALHNVPGREGAKELEDRAKHENAERAVARAKQSEREGKYGAALVDYRTAHDLVPDLPGLAESIAAMEKEMKSLALVEKAQIDMRAARFDAAHEKLAEAFELSFMARNDIARLVLETKALQGEHEYRAARDLEVLGKKAEALAAFEALAKNWPDGVSDERARIDSLRVDIDGANVEWALGEAAEGAGDLPKALEHYRNAERYYPGFKDAAQRIERLKAATAPPAPAGSGSGSGTGTGTGSGTGSGGSGDAGGG